MSETKIEYKRGIITEYYKGLNDEIKKVEFYPITDVDSVYLVESVGKQTMHGNLLTIGAKNERSNGSIEEDENKSKNLLSLINDINTNFIKFRDSAFRDVHKLSSSDNSSLPTINFLDAKLYGVNGTEETPIAGTIVGRIKANEDNIADNLRKIGTKLDADRFDQYVEDQKTLDDGQNDRITVLETYKTEHEENYKGLKNKINTMLGTDNAYNIKTFLSQNYYTKTSINNTLYGEGGTNLSPQSGSIVYELRQKANSDTVTELGTSVSTKADKAKVEKIARNVYRNIYYNRIDPDDAGTWVGAPYGIRIHGRNAVKVYFTLSSSLASESSITLFSQSVTGNHEFRSEHGVTPYWFDTADSVDKITELLCDGCFIILYIKNEIHVYYTPGNYSLIHIFNSVGFITDNGAMTTSSDKYNHEYNLNRLCTNLTVLFSKFSDLHYAIDSAIVYNVILSQVVRQDLGKNLYSRRRPGIRS